MLEFPFPDEPQKVLGVCRLLGSVVSVAQLKTPWQKIKKPSGLCSLECPDIVSIVYTGVPPHLCVIVQNLESKYAVSLNYVPDFEDFLPGR